MSYLPQMCSTKNLLSSDSRVKFHFRSNENIEVSLDTICLKKLRSNFFKKSQKPFEAILEKWE